MTIPNPEVAELLSPRNLVLYGAALCMTFLVSVARVGRERGAQRAAGKPLTTTAEMLWDALYGSLAAIALLLLQDSIKALPIKAAIALAMFYGSVGPSAWDFFAGLASGKYAVTRKEASSDGKTDES